MPPYVGMARKQNGGFNASISVLTPIFHLVVNSTRLKIKRAVVSRSAPPDSPRNAKNCVQLPLLAVAIACKQLTLMDYPYL